MPVNQDSPNPGIEDREEALSKRLEISETGMVGPGDTIVPPWGSVRHWSLILSVEEMGQWETITVNNNDNALLHVIARYDARPDGRGWVVESKCMFKGASNAFHNMPMEIRYLLVAR